MSNSNQTEMGFIEIDEDGGIERIQMKIVDDEGNEINAGSFDAEAGRYALVRESETTEEEDKR